MRPSRTTALLSDASRSAPGVGCDLPQRVLREIRKVAPLVPATQHPLEPPLWVTSTGSTMSATCPVYLQSLRVVALRARRTGPTTDSCNAACGMISYNGQGCPRV